MSRIFLIFCLSISSSFAVTTGWKGIAESTDCNDNIQILAKEGESFIYLVRGNEKIKLFSEDKSTFKKDNMKSVIYASIINSKGEVLSFVQPAVVAALNPKLYVRRSDKDAEIVNCKMRTK